MTIIFKEETETGFRMVVRRHDPSWLSRFIDGAKAAFGSVRTAAVEAKPVAEHTLSYFSNGLLHFSDSPAAVAPSTILHVSAAEKPAPQGLKASLRDWYEKDRKGFFMSSALFASAAGLAIAGCVQNADFSSDSAIVASADDAQNDGFSATRIYETDHTRTVGIDNEDEDAMRRNIETYIDGYVDNFVARMQEGRMDDVDRCASFDWSQANPSRVTALRSRGAEIASTPKQYVVVFRAPGHGREVPGSSTGFDTGAIREVSDGHEVYESRIVAKLGETIDADLASRGYIVINMRDIEERNPSLSGLDAASALSFRSRIVSDFALAHPEALVIGTEDHLDSPGVEEIRSPAVYAYADWGRGEIRNEQGRVTGHYSRSWSAAFEASKPEDNRLAPRMASPESFRLAQAFHGYRNSEWAPHADVREKDYAVIRCQSRHVASVLFEMGNLGSDSDWTQFDKVLRGVDGKAENLSSMYVAAINEYVAARAPSLATERPYGFQVNVRTGLPSGSVNFSTAMRLSDERRSTAQAAAAAPSDLTAG
ncbi:MAG: hypothetical protein AB7E85_05910 [Pseudobdellovibrionaceae bacterium]